MENFYLALILAYVILFIIESMRLTLLALMLRASSLAVGLRRSAGTATLLSILTPSILLGILFIDVIVFMTMRPLSTAVVFILLFLAVAAYIAMLVIGLINMLGIKGRLDRALPAREQESTSAV